MKESFDVMIIGGGIAGSAAALRAAQNGMSVLWFLGTATDAIRSRGQWVADIDNVSGFNEGIIKKQILRTLRRNKETSAMELIENSHYVYSSRSIIDNTKARLTAYEDVTTVKQTVENLKQQDGRFIATTKEGEFFANAAVLATGLMDRQPIIHKKNKDGEVEPSIKWIFPYANKEQVLYCIRCEGHLTRNTSITILSKGNMAAEIAMMFKERYNNQVSIVLNGESKDDITPERQTLLQVYGIPVHESPIVDIIEDDKTDLAGFVLEDETKVDAQFCMVALGIHKVYNDLAVQVGAKLLEEGKPQHERRVCIDSTSETTVPNFYAVGDVALREDESVMLQVYTAQEYAVRAIDKIDRQRRKQARDLVYAKYT